MKRGMALAEALVVCAMFLTLTSALYSLLRPGYQAWLRGQTRAHLQGNALVALHRLLHEVSASSRRSLLIFPHQRVVKGEVLHNDALALLCPSAPVTTDASGQELWTHAEVFYLNTSRGQLCEINLPLSSPLSQPSTDYLPAAVANALQNGTTPSLPISVVSSQVLSFQVGPSVSPLWLCIQTAQDNVRCTLESNAVPVLNALGSP